LLIALAILYIVWDSAKHIFLRILDGVEDNFVDDLVKVTAAVKGVLAVAEVRARWIGHFRPEERQSLYTEAFSAAIAGSDPEALFMEVFGQSDAGDWTDATLDADVNLYLPDDLLVKMDRATMAHSLEARSPFLDHILMEFVASLPPTLKLSGAQKKRVLKAALRGLLPDVVLDRPKKGFDVPIAHWFREDLREMAYDTLLSPRSMQRGYFQPQAVATLLDAHCAQREDHAELLWDLLVLELWHQTFIDGAGLSTVRRQCSIEEACSLVEPKNPPKSGTNGSYEPVR